MISNLKPPKIFYGWWVVGACFIIWILESGFIILGFTTLIEPIVNEFGWSYTQVSFAASLRGIESSVLAPLLGMLVDRYGPRRLMFVGIILVSAGLILLSRATSLGMFYGAFALVVIGLSGSTPTVAHTAVANWFRRRMGIAAGIVNTGFALGGLLIPVLVWLIDTQGWRSAVFMVALVLLFIGTPLSLLARHKPEQYGYLPDGEPRKLETLNNSTTIIDEGFGVRQAMRSRAFWHIGLALAFHQFALGAVTTHIMPYLSSIGIVRSTASLIVMAMPLIGIAGRLGSGWLGMIFSNKRVASACMAITALSLLAVSYTSNVMWLLAIFVIFFGIGWGGTSTIRPAILVEYFGRRRFGTILGFSMSLGALGSILGPLFTGWVFDNWGSYNPAWLLVSSLMLVSLIIMSTAPHPVNTPAIAFDK